MHTFIKFLYTQFLTVLDRYFYSQLFVNYLIGLSFFSSIIMINELYYIIRYYFEQNVPLYHVLSMMGALIPFLISFSVPFGVLPAYLLLLGKLSQDSELVSMRACGISQGRIMSPGIVFGVMIMLFAYNFKNTIETSSNAYYLQLKAKVLAQKPVIQLLDNVFLNIGSVQISFSRTGLVEGSEEVLYDVYAVDVKNRRTIRSKEGRIYVDPDNPEHYIMKFLDGDLNQINYVTNNQNKTNTTNQNTNLSNQQSVNSDTVVREEFYLSSFGVMTLHNYVWLPGDGYFRGPDTMTYKELVQDIAENEENKTNIRSFKEIQSNKNVMDQLFYFSKYFPKILYAQTEDQEDLIATKEFYNEQFDLIQIARNNLGFLLTEARSELPNYELMKLYDKIVLPVSALIFAILCLPLGMFSARSGRGEGLSISLVVVLIFYGFKSAIENMISQNKLPPEMIWLPTLFFAVVASVLYIRKVNE
ncbi:MAG: LptF/LptG family permease [Brevinema sp.]